jgi:hypothetical protein
MNNMTKALVIIITFMFCHYLMRNFWGDNWSEVLLSLDNESYVLHNVAKYIFIYGPLTLIATLLFKGSHGYDV